MKKIFLGALAVGIVYSLRDIIDSDNVGLIVCKVLSMYSIAWIILLAVTNMTRINIAIMKCIHRPYVVWIIRVLSVPIFAVCAIGIFGCPKPCDTTFIDTPLRIVWGNRVYKRWHNTITAGTCIIASYMHVLNS